MATLQNLYNNIKTLTTKYFEEKTIEDKTLPQWVELYFDYNNQGELNINDAPNTQNTLKFTFEGTTLSQYSSGSFNGSNMFIDYGDGTIEKTTGKFGHTYEENKTYKVRIYGIIGLTSSCFRNCTGLVSIILPDSITSLGNYCFYNCTGLPSITLPDSVTGLGNACFQNCTGLTSITLPDSVTSLGASCFQSCTGLTSITLPDSITRLGNNCFYNCTGLTEIILQWDNSSEIISYNSSWIDGCTLFDHFLIPEDTTQLYIDAGYPSELLKEEASTVVSLISDKSVSSYVYGESVVLTATAIDEGLPASGETVTFYQGETVLGTETTGDDGKASFTVTGLSVGSYSFTAGFDIYTSNTVNVTVNKLESTITLVTDKSVVDTGETYTLSGVLSVGSGESVKIYNGSTLVDTLTTGTAGSFSKTLTASGVGVTQTYHAVFEGTSIYDEATSSNVTVDVLSDNIMNLTVTGSSFSTYSSAPFTYTGRVFVDWDDDTGLIEYTGGKLTHTYSNSDDYTVKIYGDITSLERYCFYRCTGLKSITIPNSVINLGESCFQECYGLTSISIPNSVTSLGESCFSACTGLTSISIPNSVISLGTNCFNTCTGLTSITIANGLTSIGSNCFKSCTGLTSINIPNSVTNLVGYCFYGCRSLTSINIPNSVTSLGEFCFYGCSNLTSIMLNWDTNDEIITYKANWISNTPSNLLFHIPNNTTSLYIAKGYPANLLDERVVDSVSLAGDKSILSYADSESVTLSATVLDQYSYPMSSVMVEFFKNGTSLGTATTNSSGIATKTYASSSSGDVSFTATVGIISSETYTIEDCIFYDPCTSNAKASAWTIPSGVSSTYSSDGWNITANAYKQIKLTDKLTSACSVEFTLVDYNYVSAGASVIIYQYTNGETTPNQIILGNRDASSESKINVLGTTLTRQLVKGGVYRIEYTASTMKVYENDILLGSASNNVGLPTRFEIHQGAGGRYAVYKNLKVKPLNSISLATSQSILSYADSDSTVLTATHGLGSDKTVKLYDASDDSLIGTMTDNEDGTYSYTYNSQGVGDLTVYASDGNIVSEDILIEDCTYWKSTEWSLSGTNKHQVYDSNLSMSLPTDCEISFDMQIPNAAENNDYRYWLLPKSLMNGMTYPRYALFFDKKPNYILYDEQLNGAYRYGSNHKRFNTNTGYITFKYVKNGTTMKIYADDTYLFEDTVSWIDNYNDYTISLMKWSGTATMYIKNVKFKSKQSLAEAPIDELPGSELDP